MADGRTRKWLLRAGVGLVLLIAGVGAWGWANRADLEVRYAVHRLTTAATDDDRAAWAAKLAATDAGLPKLIGCMTAGDPPTRAAAVAACHTLLADPDARGDRAAGLVLDAFAAADDAGRAAVLDLLPGVLKRGAAADAEKCRAVVAGGLTMPAVESRLAAVRAAMHPAVGLRAAVLPLLDAAEPEVRRAAMFAVGPASADAPVIGDEELFRWLHDPDDGVRRACGDALASRGRSDADIRLGRRLAHPDAADRLQLLLDLRYDDDVPDPEPWLERLSRDPDPGVRAGAARVAVELAADRRATTPTWVGRLADADPDATVRRVAGFYGGKSGGGVDAAVRPAGGP